MKYLLGLLVAIGLVVLVFVLVLRGFSGNREPDNKISLMDYANTNAIVSLTVDGKINANQLHNAYEISVGRSDARMDVFQGYQRELLRTQNYQNNDEAFANFLRALELAGFNKGSEATTSQQNDPRGVCADGQRYVLRITSGASDIQRLWTTSCGGGTFKGDRNKVQQLFRLQIPDYSTLLKGVNL